MQPDSSYPVTNPAVAEERALRAASGDTAAFEALYREHLPQVYGLCLRMAGNEAAAAELTQDIFVRVWSELGKFGGGNFHGWLATLGRNLILNDRRTRARLAEVIRFEDDVAAVEPPGQRVSRETALTISAAVETLPPQGRTVFRLHDVEGYSSEEIAELLGIAPSTVRVHLHRARRSLASILLS